MTPTQWLAIPTEIRLTELPNLMSAPSDVPDGSSVFINGKKIIIKQEEYQPPTSSEESPVNNSSVYLYPVGNGLLTTSQEAVQRLAFECSPLSLGKCSPGNSIAAPDIIILKSKPKNPDYKVKNNILATKRDKPVNFKILRGRPGMKVYISLSYRGHIYEDEPVKRCKKHDECTWCKEHEYNQSFCVISKFHRFELNQKGKPTAVITLSEEHLDKEGSAEFSIVFSCWNSCDTHSRYGKEFNLQLQIADSQAMKIEYSIHCCQNLLRDAFKDRKRETYSASSGKRKQLPVAESNRECAAKTPCRIGMVSQSTDTHLTNNKVEKPVDLVVEGLDAERRDIIERMAKIMGGRTYPIPHLTKLKECETIRTDDHQSTLTK